MKVPYKSLCWVGVATYIVMLVLATAWWDLRTAFIDIAFHLFLILKDNAFEIQYYRFVAAFTQVFPLLGSRVGLPLEWIAKLYSLSFVLLYFFAFALCAFVIRRPRMALVLLLANVLMVTDTFFWIQSEMQQGIACALIGLACLDNLNVRRRKYFWFTLSLLAFFTAAFAHPLLVFPFMFVCLYLLLSRADGFDKRHVVVALLFFLMLAVVKKHFFKTWYDSRAMESAQHLVDYFPRYFFLDTNAMFARNVVFVYYWLPIGFVACLIYFVLHRRWMLLALTTVFVFGYLMLVNVSMANAGVQRFYIENMYLPLAWMLAVPLVFNVLPLLSEKRLAVPLLCVVMVSFFLRVALVKPDFQARLNWMQRTLNTHRNEKLIVPETAVPMDTLMMTWGTPYEWWLLSTIQNEQTASLMIHANPGELKDVLQNRKAFIGQFNNVYPYRQFRSRYFVFTDTTRAYRVLTTP